ncbi:peptide MFS transporter [Hankyongella ginsenosidimutans]|uniref:Peptide MFS transporter n=1 Tax=Hankyongella ginsenosidimutans TaxID=1763828 RepID=A0A4D7C4C2_9SPHN|nr:peptide MFS transporter [Hankyongella ginsenosidimutans]
MAETGAKGREPSIPVKFAIGLILVGAGYLVVVLGSQFADSQFRVALIWVALLYLLHSVGELCLSPVGLSMITKLSMAKVVGLMMGTWFLGISMAQYVGGIITQFASVETVGGAVTNPKVALETYVGVFQTIGSTAVIFGVLLLLVSPLIKRIMHGVQ